MLVLIFSSTGTDSENAALLHLPFISFPYFNVFSALFLILPSFINIRVWNRASSDVDCVATWCYQPLLGGKFDIGGVESRRDFVRSKRKNGRHVFKDRIVALSFLGLIKRIDSYLLTLPTTDQSLSICDIVYTSKTLKELSGQYVDKHTAKARIRMCGRRRRVSRITCSGTGAQISPRGRHTFR